MSRHSCKYSVLFVYIEDFVWGLHAKCIHTQIYIYCIYTHTHTHRHTYIHTYIYIYLFIYLFIYLLCILLMSRHLCKYSVFLVYIEDFVWGLHAKCIHTQIYIYIYTHTHTHTHRHTYIHIYIYIYMYIFIYLLCILLMSRHLCKYSVFLVYIEDFVWALGAKSRNFPPFISHQQLNDRAWIICRPVTDSTRYMNSAVQQICFYYKNNCCLCKSLHVSTRLVNH